MKVLDRACFFAGAVSWELFEQPERIARSPQDNRTVRFLIFL